MIYNLFQNDRLLFTYVGKPSVKQLKKFFNQELSEKIYTQGKFTIEQEMQYVTYTLKISSFELGDEYQDNITKIYNLNKLLRGKINV